MAGHGPPSPYPSALRAHSDPLHASPVPPFPLPSPPPCVLWAFQAPYMLRPHTCPSFCKASPPGTCIAHSLPSFGPLLKCRPITCATLDANIWQGAQSSPHRLSAQFTRWPHPRASALLGAGTPHSQPCTGLPGMQDTEDVVFREESPVKCQQALAHGASLVRPFCGLFPLHL